MSEVPLCRDDGVVRGTHLFCFRQGSWCSSFPTFCSFHPESRVRERLVYVLQLQSFWACQGRMLITARRCLRLERSKIHEAWLRGSKLRTGRISHLRPYL
jgi:hypothetical protein